MAIQIIADYKHVVELRLVIVSISTFIVVLGLLGMIIFFTKLLNDLDLR